MTWAGQGRARGVVLPPCAQANGRRVHTHTHVQMQRADKRERGGGGRGVGGLGFGRAANQKREKWDVQRGHTPPKGHRSRAMRDTYQVGTHMHHTWL